MKENLFIAIGVLLFLAIILFFLKQKFRSHRPRYHRPIPKNVTQVFEIGNDKFEIIGKQDNFTITKNGIIEFLVENGQIIAVKDIRISDEFIYYNTRKGNTDGTN